MKKFTFFNGYKSMTVAIAMVATLLAGCAQPQPTPTEASPPQATQTPIVVHDIKVFASEPPANLTVASSRAKNSGMYLKEYYAIEFATEVTTVQFNEALTKVSGETVGKVEGDLTYLSAIKAAVVSANFEELALTYSEEKATKTLADFGISNATEKPFLATALDTVLLTKEQGVLAANGDAISQDNATELVMSVAEANGKARNILGYSNEADIYDKINNAWDSFLLFDDAELTALGKLSVENAITTGYNLKHNLNNARFISNLTMQYGHSDIKHATQLIGLLNSEDIMAKVQLEPKVSVYQYLLEWGPVPEPSPGYEVKKFDNDLYLVFALEYDLALEFASEEDLKRFDGVINEFAKKNTGNEDAVGLIYGSWWQPLYTTTRKDMPTDAYKEIVDCVVTNGDYSIHPFSVPEKYDFVAAEFAKLAPELNVDPVTRYCNAAFYSYMLGEDYQ